MKRGWCPGVHEPMSSGDGLLIRVKPFGGKLSADALRVLADVAMRCGNGVVELTGRGNIQLRGLSEASAPTASAALVDAGLADPDPVREARRNVIAVPPCDDGLVAAIEAAMAETPGLRPKFRVEVAGTAVRASPSPTAPEMAFVEAAQRLATGTAPALPPGLLLGLPFGQTDAAALLRLAALLSPSWLAKADHPRLPGRGEEARRGSSAFAEDDGGRTTLRTTPWRSFYLQGAHAPAPFAAAGFITDPDDPRRSITACAGAPACASASVPARADAAVLAARGVRGVHVSGCAKGCAHPAAATTLVGIGGAYGFVPHGRAGDRPSITGLTIAQAAALLA